MVFMNKVKMFAAAAALLSAPVLLSSCANGAKDDTLPPKREVTAPIQLESAEPQNEPEKKPAVEPETEPLAEPVSAVEAEAAGKPLPATEETAKPAPIELPCSHTVKTNDSLWRLAAHYYGRGSQWKVIYEANRNLIKNPNRLEPGTVLNIPALPAQQ